MSENTALLLLHVVFAGARTEQRCSGTPARRADFSVFRRKQTGNKRAHLLRKGTACSSKKFEALVVLEPAHGPTPCHCFWKSDPFFSRLFAPTARGRRRGRVKTKSCQGEALNVRHEQTGLISTPRPRFHAF